MAWNQPDGNGSGRDPWGNRGGKSGPPDLDELLGNLQRRLRGLFRGGSGGGPGSGPGGGGGRTGGAGKGLRSIGTRGLVIVIALILVGWGLAGIYIVEPAEEGVVLRFGRYHETTGPGPHWAPYFIDSVEKVNVEQIRRTEIGYRTDAGDQSVPPESLMLTRDENIVDVGFAVLYRIKDARNYLFKVRDPDLSLRQATESAIREVVGRKHHGLRADGRPGGRRGGDPGADPGDPRPLRGPASSSRASTCRRRSRRTRCATRSPMR